jgi:hypothetical protein
VDRGSRGNPDLPQRGAFLQAQMRAYLDRGAPVDGDALAARVAMEHYVRTWLTEARMLAADPVEICPGFAETWKAFVDENVAGENGHRAKAEDDSFRRSFAVGRQTAFGDVDARSAVIGADKVDVGRGARDDFLRREVSLAPSRAIPAGAFRHASVAAADEASRLFSPSTTPSRRPRWMRSLSSRRAAEPGSPPRPPKRTSPVATLPEEAEARSADTAIAVLDLGALARERLGLVLTFVIVVIGDKPVSAVTRRDLGKIDLILPEIPKRTNIPKEHCVSLAARYLYAQKHATTRPSTRFSIGSIKRKPCTNSAIASSLFKRTIPSRSIAMSSRRRRRSGSRACRCSPDASRCCASGTLATRSFRTPSIGAMSSRS